MKSVMKPLNEVFASNGKKLDSVNDKITINVVEWEEGDTSEVKKLIPSINREYVFQRDLVRDFYVWLTAMFEPLFLYGPTGCGKSSFVKEAYARMGIPLYRMTISEDTELAEIFGHYVLGENGQTQFRYGPAALAAKYGYPLLLDEISRGSPSVIVGLNGLLEPGQPFVIPANGEVVVPHPNFRVCLTDNTNLAGDESGNYNTANIQDTSIPDRIGMTLKVSYPDKEEKELLAETFSKLIDDKLLASWLDQEGIKVKTASGIKEGKDVTRDDFLNAIMDVKDMIRKQSRDGGNQTAAALERTMSVRSLVRWTTLCTKFVGAPNRGLSALHYALERALTNTCTPSTKIAIHEMVKTVFGVGPTIE